MQRAHCHRPQPLPARWRTRGASVHCRAADQGSAEAKVEGARKVQLGATQLLAELLKATDLTGAIKANIESISEDFFTVASTYLDMAKKEGNTEVVAQLERTVRAAMAEKEKTLRPELRMLNQLLRDKNAAERSVTMSRHVACLQSDSYLFTFLNRMILDVEGQPESGQRTKLLLQLRSIQREAKEASKVLAKEGPRSGARKGFKS